MIKLIQAAITISGMITPTLSAKLAMAITKRSMKPRRPSPENLRRLQT